jgi:hypothetical protein
MVPPQKWKAIRSVPVVASANFEAGGVGLHQPSGRSVLSEATWGGFDPLHSTMTLGHGPITALPTDAVALRTMEGALCWSASKSPASIELD